MISAFDPLNGALKKMREELAGVDKRILDGGTNVPDYAMYREALGWHRGLLFAEGAIQEALKELQEA